MVDSKRFLMFLALFPFSEVVYIAAIFLAWIYIAFGIIGNSHTSHQDRAVNNNAEVYQNQIHFEDVNSHHERTFQWNTTISAFSVAVCLKNSFPPDYFPDICAVSYGHPEVFYSDDVISNKPKRAPPIFNS
ncbi:MAG TPA: hypothetical protein VHO90_02360 [Bacteroidales bacterium]|nr:hypothetical protein [Bacteroidales bacterium]